MSPVEQLISDQVAKSERETCEQARVGKSLVQRGDHIALVGVNVVETFHVDLHIEKTNSHVGPD